MLIILLKDWGHYKEGELLDCTDERGQDLIDTKYGRIATKKDAAKIEEKILADRALVKQAMADQKKKKAALPSVEKEKPKEEGK